MKCFAFFAFFICFVVVVKLNVLACSKSKLLVNMAVTYL